MRLVRVLKRSFINGSLREPGEEIVIGDDNARLGSNLIDVRLESEAAARGEVHLPAPEPVVPQAVFRTDLSQDITAAAGVPVFPTLESQKAFDEMTLGAKTQAEERKAQMTDLLPAPKEEPETEAVTITTPDGRVLRYDPKTNEYAVVSTPDPEG